MKQPSSLDATGGEKKIEAQKSSPKKVTIAPSPKEEKRKDLAAEVVASEQKGEEEEKKEEKKEQKKEEEQKEEEKEKPSIAPPLPATKSPFGSALSASPFSAKPAFGSVLSSFASKPTTPASSAAATPTTAGF
jgi:hypothetical protein